MLPDTLLLKEKEEMIKEKQRKHYNSHHRTKELNPLKPGDSVHIPDNKTDGTAVKESTPRSYVVKTSFGTYKCNHRHLLPLPDNTEQNCANVSNDNVEQMNVRHQSAYS